MEEMLVIAACLSLNALLAAYEMAFVSVPRSELVRSSKNGSKAATRLLTLRADPERTLSIIQVGITLVGAISAAVSGAGASEELAPYFEVKFAMTPQTAEALAILLVVLPLTFLSVVIGELVPKSIALRHPLKITLFGSRALFVADRVFSPVVTVLEWSTKQLLNFIFGRKKPTTAKVEDTNADSVYSVEIENLPHHHRQAIINLAHLERRTLRDIFVPWSEVVRVNYGSSLEEVVPLIFGSGHTRILVMQDDRVCGVLHTKEFLALREMGGADWRSAIRPALFMRSNDLVLTTLRIMQSKRSHLVVIISAAGPAAADPLGIATMEDISEEIWGDIWDEDDDGRVRKIFADRVRRKGFHEPR